MVKWVIFGEVRKSLPAISFWSAAKGLRLKSKGLEVYAKLGSHGMPWDARGGGGAQEIGMTGPS
jgi:hypothetical protein